jgi:hypothetical protein
MLPCPSLVSALLRAAEIQRRGRILGIHVVDKQGKEARRRSPVRFHRWRGGGRLRRRGTSRSRGLLGKSRNLALFPVVVDAEILALQPADRAAVPIVNGHAQFHQLGVYANAVRRRRYIRVAADADFIGVRGLLRA